MDVIKFTAIQIAEILNGKVEGNKNAVVSTISKLEEATNQSLSFLANLAYEKYLYSTKASIVLINKDFDIKKELPKDLTLIKVKDAYQAFGSLLREYEELIKKNKTGIAKSSIIQPSAKIGKNVYIGELCSIGENVVIKDDVKINTGSLIEENVVIGAKSVISSNVKILSNCKVGVNCFLDAGAVIGSEGFGFAPDESNTFHRIPQLGNVIIGNNVSIGANTCIDRATIGSTIIKDGVKIDNLVQLAHNTKVGENTVIVSQVGVAGSTTIGKNCIIAGQAGIVGHLNIEDNVLIAAQSGVTKSIKKGRKVQGSPAINALTAKRINAIQNMLPVLYKKINNLERNKNYS